MKSTTMLRNGLVLGSFGLLAGCIEPEPLPPPMCEESASIEPQPQPKGFINGVGGTNGLFSSAFHLLSSELLEATKVALTDEGGMPVAGTGYPVSQAIKDIFLKDDPMDDPVNGKEIREAIFGHAVQCALPAKVWLEDGERKYEGKGLLETTAGWFGAALETGDAEDLFTCMATLLNPNWKGVPVFLSGPSVADREESYPHVEALWAVDIASTGRPRYHVWPILDVREETNCSGAGATAEDPWKRRVCGSEAEDCGLEVHIGSWEQDCPEVELDVDGKPTKDGSHFMCKVPPSGGEPAVTKPAIRTALKTECDVQFLFCPPPQ